MEKTILKPTFHSLIYEFRGIKADRLRLHFATSKRGGTRYPPMAFTEQGVAMLSTVLNSEKAIQVNIEIMRAFARYRAIILENVDFKKELKSLDVKIDQIFRYLLEKIDALGNKENKLIAKKRIGYKRYDDE